MPPPLTVFEVSWEVAHKVGGIHTVLSTKARSMVERLGDGYVCVGPWRLGDPRREPIFDEDAGFSGFAESCRSLGAPVRVGRWRVPGRPRTVLVDASGFYRAKDDVLGRLWDQDRVDSLFGTWDYVEPLLFGHAAGIVIERWWQEFVAPHGGESLLHAHEWMTGPALLHVKARLPAIATVFTVHATVLGRALGATGASVADGLGARTPEQAAEALGVRSKHSLERATAREADVLTTVSDVTAEEVTRVLGRRPTVLVNGIDADAFATLGGTVTAAGAPAAGPVGPAGAERALRRLAERFLGRDLADAHLVATAGRPELVNKGLDVLVDALGRVDRRPGPPLVAFLFVPVGVSGVRRDLLARLRAHARPDGALPGLATHVLFDGEGAALATACAAARLDNGPERRVTVVHVAAYLDAFDGLLGLPYATALTGVDLAVFPSAYEPWGYTPIEALAAGVPTVTTDRAGFGRWANARGLTPADGVTVLARDGRTADEVAGDLADVLDRAAAGDATLLVAPTRCRATVEALAWRTVLAVQDPVYDVARRRARERALGAASAFGPAGSSATGEPEPGPDRDEVEAALPPSLRALVAATRTLRWVWDPDAPALFAELGGDAWEACDHNPVRLLADAPAAELRAEATDPTIAARVAAIAARLRADLEGGPKIPAAPPPATPVLSPWPPLPPADPRGPDAAPALSDRHPVAYFCAEFGLHESLPIYSGGLGVLAGDHVKAAHDARLPLVGVGLFYRRGFLRQHVSVQGEQIPFPIEIHPREQPVTLVRDADGAPLKLELDLPGTRLVLVAWRVDVGNVPLYLLDADVPDNRPEDRSVTHRLYTGDAEARLRQEIVLGKGGVRLLARLGIDPAVVHMNEGHAAFAPLERVSRLVHQEGLTFDEAAAMVRASTVFTTHTPVPAGHDRFPEPLLRRYFADAPAWLGIPWERFLGLGRVGGELEFNMTVLGLKMSAFRNAVSRLHGEVSRRLLGASWPGLLPEEVPVTHVTNGVHLATWTAPALGRVLGATDRSVVADDFSARGADVDLDALWAARADARRATLAAVRRHVREACDERREPAAVADRMTAGFTEDALLLGFARRFATYKRADLLLRDVRRLEAIVNRADRPVRFLFAGKAHPSDRAGQDVLRRIVEASRRDSLAGKLLFLDDYDMGLARELVRGVDVWVNTPVRGLEASGTSGMKAAANGALHLSIRDGWWDEAYDGTNGFVLGATPGRGASAEANDDLDAASFYRVLEDEIAPLFFDRDARGVPRRWLERVRRCLTTLPPTFDARRMLDEYADRAYRPLAEAGRALARDGYAAARDAAERQRRLRAGFPAVRFVGRRPGTFEGAVGGVELEVVAELDLGALTSDDVVVEALATGAAGQGRVLGALAADGRDAPTTRAFRGRVVVPHDGPRTLAVRVRARATGPADASGLEALVLWG